MADQTNQQDNQKTPQDQRKTDRPEELEDTQLETTAGGKMALNPKGTQI